jgi:alkylation response protein AidB-like acyl-CoA dehydrogenase
VGADDILGEIHGGWAVIDHMINYGAVLKAAEMSGGAQAALNLAVNYTKKRVQFGRPIATHQSIQHTLVKMLTESDSLRNQVYEAAWNISMGTPSRLLSSGAKVKANRAYHRICYDAILAHGAIGWTAEMDISMYLLRAKDLENDCGGTDFHRERIAQELEKQTPAFLT